MDLTQPQALAKDAARRHVLLLLQLGKVGGAGKDQDVGHVHDALQYGHSLLNAQALVGLQDLNFPLQSNKARQLDKRPVYIEMNIV